MGRRLLYTAPLALLLLVPAALRAQTVRGAVLDSAGGRPADGVLVVLLDAEGRQRGRAMTDGSGTFSLAAPAAGTYRLRAERVGQRSVLSAAMVLAAGEARRVELRVGGAPVSLRGLVATADARRCRVRPADGMQAATLWEEARKALNAADWANERQIYRYGAATYRRELDPATLAVRDERRSEANGAGRHPFVSLPAEELQREGYVRAGEDGATYYAPDAAVLLSDAFLDGHCLRFREGVGADAGLVGLAFEPLRGRRHPDVEGVLWLDRETAELRHLEYRYTSLPVAVPVDRLGGRVEFRRLPTGAWMVSRWWIRMPVVTVEQSTRRLNEGVGLEQRERALLAGIREEGGEVTSVRNPDGTPLLAASRAALTGVVFDSTRVAPLPGATVFLSGTGFSATTDDAGRFRIDGLPAGRYSVSFHHPRLDSLGVVVVPREAEVGREADVALEMGVPAVRTRETLAGRPSNAGADRPLPLEELRVTGRPRSAALADFHRRAAVGNGYFVTRETIERRRPVHTVDLFRGVPAFDVVGQTVRLRMSGAPTPGGLSAFPMNPEGGVGWNASGRDLSSTQAGPGGSGVAAQAQAEKAQERDRPADCVPALFLDGAPFEPLGGELAAIRPGDVEGIEVYARASLAPAPFRRGRTDCGIILIWLRDRNG